AGRPGAPCALRMGGAQAEGRMRLFKEVRPATGRLRMRLKAMEHRWADDVLLSAQSNPCSPVSGKARARPFDTSGWRRRAATAGPWARKEGQFHGKSGRNRPRH